MKFITRLAAATFLFFGVVLPVMAGGPPMVFSQGATISAENGELTIPEGQAWKIPVLPRAFNCPVGKTCAAISIKGMFQVGDNGNPKNGPAKISAEQLNNQSSRMLAVLVNAENPSFGTHQSFRLDIPPNDSREIGHLEGWTFVSGDQINVSHAEYAPIITKLP